MRVPIFTIHFVHAPQRLQIFFVDFHNIHMDLYESSFILHFRGLQSRMALKKSRSKDLLFKSILNVYYHKLD